MASLCKDECDQRVEPLSANPRLAVLHIRDVQVLCCIDTLQYELICDVRYLMNVHVCSSRMHMSVLLNPSRGLTFDVLQRAAYLASFHTVTIWSRRSPAPN